MTRSGIANREMSTSLLDNARQMVNYSDFGLSNVKAKMKTIAVIFSIGIVGILVAITVIYFGLPKTEAAQILTVFLLLGSIAVVIVALIGDYLVTRGAYISEYIQRLEAEYDAESLAAETCELVAVLEAIAEDPTTARATYERLRNDLKFKHLFEST